MNPNLFKIALEHLKPSDWEHFEELCSKFLVAEFESMRTMASPSGDGGRDSELFSPHEKPFIAAQYSVTQRWRDKIRATRKRIMETSQDTRILIFMSNQHIGAQADDLKTELLNEGLMLDVRDFHWFVERSEDGELRQAAAEELIDRIARPYLAGEQIIEKKNSPLTSGEARAALLYLGMQWQDDATEKGLTKLSFEALVRSSLRHTNSNRRVSRAQIHERIHDALPSADRTIISQNIDKALARLEKKYIRHWTKEDEFCLTHEESERILNRLIDESNQEADFLRCVHKHCSTHLQSVSRAQSEDLQDLTDRIPRILEQLLLRQGELFVSAVKGGNLDLIGTKHITDIVTADVAKNRPESAITHYYPAIITESTRALLSESDEAVHIYLRKLANSYTLLSFLNETPDVQSATRKLFSYGSVWIDTTVLLPLLAEQIEPSSAKKSLSQVFATARSAGIDFYVTRGIIQEIDAHMTNALSCSTFQTGTWRGRVPYLYQKFLETGQTAVEFRKWLALFRGNERPEDDIAQYLEEVFGFKKRDLDTESQTVPEELRYAAERLWREAHQARRQSDDTSEQSTTDILIRHDIETYLGVVGLRIRESVSEMGYRNWLLTLDRNAWDIRNRLIQEFPSETPPSPLLSLSFFVGAMTFGLMRSKVGKHSELRLPIILDDELSSTSIASIVEIADGVRKENENLPEFVIRRRVRDAIDNARRNMANLGYSANSAAKDAEQ